MRALFRYEGGGGGEQYRRDGEYYYLLIHYLYYAVQNADVQSSSRDYLQCFQYCIKKDGTLTVTHQPLLFRDPSRMFPPPAL